jgi:hypothetical protein
MCNSTERKVKHIINIAIASLYSLVNDNILSVRHLDMKLHALASSTKRPI